MARNGIVVVSLGVCKGLVEHSTRGLIDITQLLNLFERYNLLLEHVLRKCLTLWPYESLNKALLVAVSLVVEHESNDLSELADRYRNHVRACLLQEGKLELIQLQRVHFVHYQVRCESFVAIQCRLVQALHVLQVLAESIVQKSGCTLQRNTLIAVPSSYLPTQLAFGSRRSSISF